MTNKTQLYLIGGQIIETDNPIIYSGNFLLVTDKTVSTMGTIGVVTSVITPHNLNNVTKIITNNLSKIYKDEQN